MGKLIYSAITSLDGYIEDAGGDFGWAEPDDEVHKFVNEIERPIGIHLYGRRMYETMVYWETVDTSEDESPIAREFAQSWRAAEKVVFSRTLKAAHSARTTIEPVFEPDAIRQLKDAAPCDVSIGGPDLAASAFQSGLIDECHLFLNPIVVGGGKRALPSKVRLGFALIDEQRFGNGVVHLHYSVTA